MKKELEIILKKMCELANVSYDNIDFKNDSFWYDKYWWSIEKQQEFREWLIYRLEKNKKSRELLMNYSIKDSVNIKKTVDMFILSFGFTTNKDKAEELNLS